MSFRIKLPDQLMAVASASHTSFSSRQLSKSPESVRPSLVKSHSDDMIIMDKSFDNSSYKTQLSSEDLQRVARERAAVERAEKEKMAREQALIQEKILIDRQQQEEKIKTMSLEEAHSTHSPSQQALSDVEDSEMDKEGNVDGKNSENEAGPTGPVVLTGPTGPMVSTGPTGPMVSTGPTGPMGSTGPMGMGSTGPTGPMGPPGLTIPSKDSTGPTGPTGPKGETGLSAPKSTLWSSTTPIEFTEYTKLVTIPYNGSAYSLKEVNIALSKCENVMFELVSGTGDVLKLLDSVQDCNAFSLTNFDNLPTQFTYLELRGKVSELGKSSVVESVEFVM